jgi:hypothetical protein
MTNPILSGKLGKTSEIETLTRKVSDLTHSFDQWNHWMLWGLAFAAGAAVWIGITTRMTVVKSKQLAVAQGNLDGFKADQLKIDLKDKDEKIAAARERAAEADLKRVQLQDRIVEIFGSRDLSQAQRNRVRAALTGLKGVKIDVLVIDEPGNAFTASPDSLNLGKSILGVLRDAHMDAAGWILESCKPGVQVANLAVISTGDKDDDANALRVLGAFSPEIETYSKLQHESPMCEKFSDLEKHDPNKRGHTAKITIAIGIKVQPILTREMLEPTQHRP